MYTCMYVFTLMVYMEVRGLVQFGSPYLVGPVVLLSLVTKLWWQVSLHYWTILLSPHFRNKFSFLKLCRQAQCKQLGIWLTLLSAFIIICMGCTSITFTHSPLPSHPNYSPTEPLSNMTFPLVENIPWTQCKETIGKDDVTLEYVL